MTGGTGNSDTGDGSAGGGATLSMAGAGGYAMLTPDTDTLARYGRIAAGDVPRRDLARIAVPARAGKAVRVDAGQVLRITCTDGPQVADFCVFNAHDPDERFWSARTRVIHGGHLAVGHRLWSCPPAMRPMMTLIADTVTQRPHEHGARTHDLLFCRCDSRHYEVVHGWSGMPNCNDNLAGAIGEFGLPPAAVHDPFNIFMTTGINPDGRPFYLPSDARQGDYVELIAEIDCLAAVSACPGGSSGDRSHGLEMAVFAVGG